MPQPSLLIFNRDRKYLTRLTQQFQQASIQVKTFTHPAEVLRCLQDQSFDLLVLDICTLALHGVDLLEEIRRMRGNIPILVLTGDPDLNTAIKALRFHVRDYLTAPLPFDQLHARICDLLAEIEEEIQRKSIINQMQSLLNQFRDFGAESTLPPGESSTPATSPHLIQHGTCTVNLTTREVTLEGYSFLLSPTEFNYWLALLHHAPDLVTHKALVLEAQGYTLSNQEAMDMARWHIHELRKTLKAGLKKDPIQTIRGVGYCLNL